MMTILKNEAADGGLEVRDFLMRWSNDRFRSSRPRVANPRSGGGATA